MPNESATAEGATTDNATTDLEVLAGPAPKDGVDGAEGGSQPEPDAKASGTSSSTTPTAKLSPDEALELAARAERAATLRREEADRLIKEANDKAAASEKSKQEYDAKLAQAARLMLASEKLTRGEKKEALKDFMGEAYNKAEMMELIATDFDAADGVEPEPEPVEKVVEKLLDSRDKKKAEAAEEERKAAEAKKAEDDKKKADEDRATLVKEWKEEAVRSIKAEEHPILSAKLAAWTEDFGEEKAQEMMRARIMDTFYRVAKDHKKALDPDEAVGVAELEFAKKKKPTKTLEDEIDDEAEEIDARYEREEKTATSLRRDAAPPPKRKALEEMTAEDLVFAELDEIEKRGGRGLYSGTLGDE